MMADVRHSRDLPDDVEPLRVGSHVYRLALWRMTTFVPTGTRS